jgi:hypothetical protein
MTESELLDIAQGYTSNAIGLTAIFLSVLTAYLVVAYTVGKKLSFSQVGVVNAFFFVVAIFMIGGQTSLMTVATEAENTAQQISTWRTVPIISFIPYALQVFFLLFVFASLKFMWDIRHPKIE